MPLELAARPLFLSIFLAAASLAVLPARAETPEETASEALAAEEQLLGSRARDRAWADLLPFTRQFTARGFVGPDLQATAFEAGVPASALLEPLRALAARLESTELSAADKFRLTWEQTIGQDGAPIGSARVTGLELASAKKGVVALSRFRAFTGPTAGQDVFYFADGTLAAPPPIRLPLDEIKITSGYGLRGAGSAVSGAAAAVGGAATG